MSANIQVDLRVLSANMTVNMGDRECICLTVCEYTCEYFCLGAKIRVNVGIRE